MFRCIACCGEIRDFFEIQYFLQTFMWAKTEAKTTQQKRDLQNGSSINCLTFLNAFFWSSSWTHCTDARFTQCFAVGKPPESYRSLFSYILRKTFQFNSHVLEIFSTQWSFPKWLPEHKWLDDVNASNPNWSGLSIFIVSAKNV